MIKLKKQDIAYLLNSIVEYDDTVLIIYQKPVNVNGVLAHSSRCSYDYDKEKYRMVWYDGGVNEICTYYYIFDDAAAVLLDDIDESENAVYAIEYE